jgi:transcription initiation factor TFIIIB Brf1 subunit/transcription initiation factor TFIIB
MSECPICGCQANVTDSQGNPRVDCPRCGVFVIGTRAFDQAQAWATGQQPDCPAEGRFAASHAIRRMQVPGRPPPIITSEQLRLLWAQPLPNPQRQADLLLMFLGDANLPIDQYVPHRQEALCAEIGSRDQPGRPTAGFNLIRKRLSDKGLIETNSHPTGSNVELRLTFDGWAEYERLRRETVESKTAFMAMDFSNALLARIVADYFVPAVKEAGFTLRRLDDQPRAGIIDNRMRVELRAAKFVVCDLTDENRGAYWESGFAEGAGKPVFYTCEKKKFKKTKSHFDTEHLFTVRWDESNPAEAADELRDAIRNEFPADAVPPDLSKG